MRSKKGSIIASSNHLKSKVHLLVLWLICMLLFNYIPYMSSRWILPLINIHPPLGWVGLSAVFGINTCTKQTWLSNTKHFHTRHGCCFLPVSRSHSRHNTHMQICSLLSWQSLRALLRTSLKPHFSQFPFTCESRALRACGQVAALVRRMIFSVCLTSSSDFMVSKQ